ncbi:ATP-binding protein [Niveispirillum sp. BGYR6]|uniref:ATP-binding protein n=1 Tax=Niveispirillum sp. BGYR6 TaxID=2971249 RepID=UPI0022B96AD2|nr:ATP-binding protein [Niveispirillum sp. BGYR6]
MTALPPTPPAGSDRPPESAINIGGDLAPAMLRRIAVLHGFGIAPPGAPCTIMMTLRATDRELQACLAGGARGYVEVESDLGLPAPALRGLAAPDRLHVSVTTASCFSMAMPPILGGEMIARGWLRPDRVHDLELCLHEAVSNAVVHGNLGIRNGPGGDREAFDRFHREIHSRMAMRDYARRRVSIDISNEADQAVVAVSDEGEGYQAASPDVAPDAKSGRGLRLLRELADAVDVTAGGSRISMMFKR